MPYTATPGQLVPRNVIRFRDWTKCKVIIGELLYNFLNDRFKQLNTRGKFNILEIGCGQGNTSIQLEQEYNNCNIIAIDLNNDSHILLHNKTVYLQEDIQQFVFEDSFDCIIGIAVLPYVKDKLLALLNIWRSLKLHGVAVVSIQPYHFGPYGLSMFSEGDIIWDQDHQALVIYKSSTELQLSNLPCLNYKYIEYEQDFEILTHNGYIRRNLWPSFLKFPIYIDPLIKRPVEQRPYPESMVSLYVQNSVDISDDLAQTLFKEKSLYPKIMVRLPGEYNHDVMHEKFEPSSARILSMLSPEKQGVVEHLIEKKNKEREVYYNSQKTTKPRHSCFGWLRSTLLFLRPQESAVEQGISCSHYLTKP